MDKIAQYIDEHDLSSQNNEKEYIIGSRQNIDNFISKKEYKRAFWLLIFVLERLDDTQKIEFIDYYSNNLDNFLK